MFGGVPGADRGLFDDVVRALDRWIPEREYQLETRFRDDLQDFLDRELNETDDFGIDIGLGRGHVPVSTEHGTENVDVCVDDSVAIELKRNLTNSQTKKFRGQLDAYRDEYPFVIGCACGIEDMDGWRKLQGRFESGGIGFGLDESEVVLIHKKRENFGKDPQSGWGDDLLY